MVHFEREAAAVVERGTVTRSTSLSHSGAYWLLPESEIGLWGRSLPCPISFLHPAGLRIGLVRQGPSPPDKLIAPCRIENRACGAGVFPARQANRPLPD